MKQCRGVFKPGISCSFQTRNARGLLRFSHFRCIVGVLGLGKAPSRRTDALIVPMGALISGAPIRAGGASPFRVATGGDANWRFKPRLRHSPATTNRRRGWRLRIKSPIESGSPWDFIPGLLTTISVLVCSPRDTQNSAIILLFPAGMWEAEPRKTMRNA